MSKPEINRVGKAYLVRHLMKTRGFNQADAAEAVDGVLGGFIEALLDGSMVAISNFGTLYPKEAQPRLSRNPQTGEPLMTEVKTVVRWRSSPTFSDVLNGKANRDLVMKAPKTPRKG